MTLDLAADETAVLTRLSALCGGRVLDFIPDDKSIPRDSNGDIQPYITVAFGEPYRAARDRSITGEEDQPMVWPVSATAWGKTTSDTRPTANAIRVLMIGWAPSNNCTPFSGGGGGSFASTDASGRPTLSARTVGLESTVNQSST